MVYICYKIYGKGGGGRQSIPMKVELRGEMVPSKTSDKAGRIALNGTISNEESPHSRSIRIDELPQASPQRRGDSFQDG